MRAFLLLVVILGVAAFQTYGGSSRPARASSPTSTTFDLVDTGGQRLAPAPQRPRQAQRPRGWKHGVFASTWTSAGTNRGKVYSRIVATTDHGLAIWTVMHPDGFRREPILLHPTTEEVRTAANLHGGKVEFSFDGSLINLAQEVRWAPGEPEDPEDPMRSVAFSMYLYELQPHDGVSQFVVLDQGETLYVTQHDPSISASARHAYDPPVFYKRIATL